MWSKIGHLIRSRHLFTSRGQKFCLIYLLQTQPHTRNYISALPSNEDIMIVREAEKSYFSVAFFLFLYLFLFDWEQKKQFQKKYISKWSVLYPSPLLLVRPIRKNFIGFPLVWPIMRKTFCTNNHLCNKANTL